MSDVGTSGWSGFQSAAGLEQEVAWYRGGHSAALAAENLNSLADFVATGRVTTRIISDRGPSRGMSILSQLAPWLARILLGLVIGLAARSLWRAPRRGYRFAVLASVATAVMILLDVV